MKRVSDPLVRPPDEPSTVRPENAQREAATTRTLESVAPASALRVTSRRL